MKVNILNKCNKKREHTLNTIKSIKQKKNKKEELQLMPQLLSILQKRITMPILIVQDIMIMLKI